MKGMATTRWTMMMIDGNGLISSMFSEVDDVIILSYDVNMHCIACRNDLEFSPVHVKGM
jgi:hypothetical protein